MNIAIYSRIFKPEQSVYIIQLFERLELKGANIVLHNNWHAQLLNNKVITKQYAEFSDYFDLKEKDIDVLISLGGDGTLLDTVSFVRDSGIIVAGINLGRLGFLANIQKYEIEELVNAIFARTYTVEKRTLIEVNTSENVFGDISFGLNEFAIHKTDSSSMIVVHTYLNGEFLNSYWADGLIVCTPTGSTAYSLSCEGPIVFPSSSSFVITPVAPHNLNARPFVIPDNTIVSFEVECRADHFLCTIDSRYVGVEKSLQIAVKKAGFYLNVLRLPESHYFKTLREKLSWGEDTRN
jgi:NAD+ kinase